MPDSAHTTGAPVTHAITVQLPWAAAIRAAVKTIENRGRRINPEHLGTRVAIHAGARWSTAGGCDPRINTWWWGDASRSVDPSLFPHLFRHLVAVATITDCHQADQEGPYTSCCQPWAERNYPDGSFRPAWHIVLADIVPIDQPIGPLPGRLHIPWKLPEPVSA